MTELLDIYDYSDDEEDRQIAHIVLLELVIDRWLIFLLFFVVDLFIFVTASE